MAMGDTVVFDDLMTKTGYRDGGGRQNQTVSPLVLVPIRCSMSENPHKDSFPLRDGDLGVDGEVSLVASNQRANGMASGRGTQG